ncbi:MAG: carboxypeptidase regulatory-like domain-containing protein [Acidobacteria bacterium]|nr:carboxypeptidase regulatory-like domain-containing protein [Acidobacteriota bacterium]
MKVYKYNVLAGIAVVSISMAAVALEQGIGIYRLLADAEGILAPIVNGAEVAEIPDNGFGNVESRADLHSAAPADCVAGQKTWDGEGLTNNWSEPANWTCDQVPANTDLVIFDGTSTKDAFIDTNITVNRWQINAGYTGTITQGPSSSVSVLFNFNAPFFTQSSGNFVCSSAPVTFESSIVTFSGGTFDCSAASSMIVRATSQAFSLNGGTFTAPAGTLSFNGGVVNIASASFSHNNGTVAFRGYDGPNGFSCCVTLNIDGALAGQMALNNLNLDNSLASGQLTLSDQDVLVANGTLSLLDGDLRMLNPNSSNGNTAIHAFGPVVVSPNWGNATGDTGDATVKLLGNSARTVEIPSGLVGTFNAMVVDAPNTIVNATGNGELRFYKVDLIQGTINTGVTEFGYGNQFPYSSSSISGGTFNCGTGTVTGRQSVLVMTGGIFDCSAASEMSLLFSRLDLTGGLFTAPAATMNLFGLIGGVPPLNVNGGTFLHNNGTLKLGRISSTDPPVFSSQSGIEVNGSQPGTLDVNNVVCDDDVNNPNTFSALFGGGDTIRVRGNFTLSKGQLGQIGSGALPNLELFGDLSVNGTAVSAGGFSVPNIRFVGTGDQNVSRSGTAEFPGGSYFINKPSGSVISSGDLDLTYLDGFSNRQGNDLSIQSGRLYLNNESNLRVRNLTLNAAGSLVNDSSTTITLFGNVINNGIIDLQGGGAACPENDTILIRSNNTTQRTWTGTGIYRLVDVDVERMGGTGNKNVFSGTNSGNNNATWIFNSGCPEALSLSPTTATVQTAATQQFTASGGFGTRTFSLAVNNSGGSINPTTGFYTAGSAPGTTDTVRVTDGIGSTIDASVTVFGPPTQVAFTSQPVSTTGGAILNTITVAVQDAAGTTLTNSTAPVTLSIADNPGGGVLSGTVTRNAVNGIATFNDLSINKAGAGYTLLASSGSLASATSNAFNIIVGAATKLTFLTQPADTVPNTQFQPIQVAVQDAGGNTVVAPARSISLGISGFGTLAGTTFRTTVNGVAIFNNVSVPTFGTGRRLSATSSGLPLELSDQFNVDAIFTVTNTNDSGPGSLRQAILNSNAGSNFPQLARTIRFDIPGAGPHTIAPLTVLPVTTARTLIDGTSQPGYTGIPRVQITGSNLPLNSITPNIGLNVGAPGSFSEVRGLSITNFKHTSPAMAAGIFLGPSGFASPNVTVVSNYVGVTPGGVAGGNNVGIQINGSAAVIGGTDPALGNVISGNSTGLFITFNSTTNTVIGNKIGTNPAGTVSIANVVGLRVEGTNNIIGGNAPGSGNIISGNTQEGLILRGRSNLIRGNTIGRNAANTANIPNLTGIALQSGVLLTGGLTPGADLIENNIVAGNTRAGIDASTTASSNYYSRGRFQFNSIFLNGGLGIALSNPLSQTPNDQGDVDVGPNDKLNSLEITSVAVSGGTTEIRGGFFKKTEGDNYRVDFYSNTNCSTITGRSAQNFIESKNFSLFGNSPFKSNLLFTLQTAIPFNEGVSAIIVDSLGNTSEISPCRFPVPGVSNVSGRILENGVTPIPNLTVRETVTGKTAVTNVSGEYTITGLTQLANYTITPISPNHVFTPASIQVTNLTGDVTEQNFSAARTDLVLSVKVNRALNGSVMPLDNVSVQLTGGANRTATTDVNGNAIFNGVTAGNYAVSVSRNGYVFTPNSQNVNLTTDQTTSFNGTAVPADAGRLIDVSAGAAPYAAFSFNADGSSATPVLDYTEIARITFNHLCLSASISPDGRKIAAGCRVITPQGAVPLGYLFIANHDGSGRITANASGVNPTESVASTMEGVSWSADGTKIAYIADKRLRVVNATGAGVTTIYTANAKETLSSTSWAPDGLSIVVTSEQSGTIRTKRVSVADGTTVNFLPVGAKMAAFSPNGQKVAFIQGTTLRVANADGTGATSLLPAVQVTTLTWSPDSQKIGFTESGGIWNTVNADGTGRVQTDRRHNRPHWGPTFEPVTPVGSNVNVQSGGVSMTFSSVTSSGDTTILPIPPNSAGTTPGGFSIGEFGAWEISTTANVTPPINLCFTLPTYVGQAQFNSLNIMHNENGVLVNRTTSRTFATRTICATVNSLSPFVIAEEIDSSLPTVSGVVQDPNGEPMAGVQMLLSGTDERSTFTDSNGVFNFVNLTEDGSYIVTPKLPGYIFGPSSDGIESLTGDQTMFFTGTATTYTISGRAYDGNGTGIPNVEINVGGGSNAATMTDADGNYSIAGLPADAPYVVSATKEDVDLANNPKIIDTLIGDRPNVDFTTDGDCLFSIDPTLQNYTNAGGSGSIAVTANDSQCDWTAVSNDAWITVTSGASGSGNGTVEYSVTANTGDVRTGSITVAGETFTVTQAASCPTVSIPTSGLTGAPGTSLTVPVNVTDITGRGATAYDFTLTYDPAVLEFTGESIAGTLSSNYLVQVNEPIAGTLVVSGFGVDDLTGAGVLLKLQFDITATTSSCSTLHLAVFEFNEGTPCVVTEDGEACSENRRVTGLVTYGNSLTPPAVPNVTISGSGSPNVSTITDADGLYELTGFGAGAYTLTPSKTGHTAAITAFDAAITARHVIGTVILNATQQTVADVSNNGTISSFDASQIARFAVGNPNTGTAGTWRFTPPSRNYAAVNGHIAAQDHVALLMGEVSGNWAVAPPPEPLTEGVPPISVSLPNVSSGTSTTVLVPITTGDVTARGVISHQFEVSYNPAVAVPNAVPVEKAGTLSGELLVVSNTDTPGILRVAVYGTEDIVGEGTLLNLRFDVVGAPGTSTPLNFVGFMFNENDPQSSKTNGSISVLVPTNAGVEVSGRVMTPDGRGLRNATVTMTDANGVVRNAVTSSFGYYRFEGVPVGDSFVMTVNSRSYRFVPRVVNVLDNMTDVDFIGLE